MTEALWAAAAAEEPTQLRFNFTQSRGGISVVQLSELQLGALSELVTSGSSLGETGKGRKKRPAKKVGAAEVARMQAHTAQNLMRQCAKSPSLSFLKVLSATERQMYLRPLTPSGA